MKGTSDIARDNALQQLGKAQAGLLPIQVGGEGGVTAIEPWQGRECTDHDFTASSTLGLHQKQTSTVNFSCRGISGCLQQQTKITKL